MQILAVDDEKIALERLVSVIEQAQPGTTVTGFRSPEQARDFAQNTPCDIAFLDIEMREMDGITLAKQLKMQNPKLNIIFSTGYNEYAMDAWDLSASGYLLKPITAEMITREIAHLRNPILPESSKRVQVHTFGNFEVYLDGRPVEFQFSKSKELLAYLVDRQGVLCTNNELMAVLWEDEVKESYFKKLRADLFAALPQQIFARQWGKLGIVPELLECDYYNWLKGTPTSINAYTGEYMTQYSWSEGKLEHILPK